MQKYKLFPEAQNFLYFCSVKHMDIMKRNAFYALLLSLLALGCQQKETSKDFAFDTHQGRRCFVVLGSNELAPDNSVVGLENSYNLAWPKTGMLTPEAERELIVRCFGDSLSTTFDEAAEHLLYLTWGYDEGDAEIQLLELKTDSIADTLQYTYGHLESTCEVSGNLATFVIEDEIYRVGAAHGMYSVQYVNVDVNKGTILHLYDLMDTTRLGEAILKAVNTLDVNEEVRGCLFEEFVAEGCLPVPQDFLIDSARSTITMVYQLYEVAPYVCGIQSVEVPVEWLAAQIQMTPYAKEFLVLSKAEEARGQ